MNEKVLLISYNDESVCFAQTQKLEKEEYEESEISLKDTESNNTDEKMIMFKEQSLQESLLLIDGLVPDTQEAHLYFQDKTIPKAYIHHLTKKDQTVRLYLHLTNTDDFDYLKGWNVSYSKKTQLSFTNPSLKKTIIPNEQFTIELVGFNFYSSLSSVGVKDCLFNFQKSSYNTNKLKNFLKFTLIIM